MAHILVIDDEPAIRWGFSRYFGKTGHTVVAVESAEKALSEHARPRPDVIILDVRLPGMDGLEAVAKFRALWGDVPIVVITAYGNLDTAVRAIRTKAFEYLTKPFDLEEAAAVVSRALEQRRSVPATGGLPEEKLVGSSPAMQRVFKQIAQAASSEIPVLILGETGTGKEMVAQAIHKHSHRADRPFVPVCLPALSENVIESELFGYVKGAFTGAAQDKDGLIALADGGTLFLDEIADIPLAVQAKLLRAIEHREIIPVGSTQLRRVDFRLIAATNQPLEQLVQSGQFRSDLFYRLSVFTIWLPPLRDRKEDIAELAEYFLARATSNSSPKRLSPEVVRRLQEYHWPGNVRQLRNVIECAASTCTGSTVQLEHLPPLDAHPANLSGYDSLQQAIDRWVIEQLSSQQQGNKSAHLYRRFLSVAEPVVLRRVMEHFGGNLAQAARFLGLSRLTLREKLKKHRLR